MKNEQIKEYTIRITQANPISMITILYEMTITYLTDAVTKLSQNDKTEFVNNIHMAQDCIRELQNSLNMQYEPATALQALYIYMHREMASAIINTAEEPLQVCRNILDKLAKAYKELEQTGSWEPVMENVQKVYTGYTYGRNSMPQSMAEQSGSRGYLA